MFDRNDLAYWFPRLESAGVPVPRTEIVRTTARLADLLDGQRPEGYEGFIAELTAAAERISFPAFLRTGHTSNKHRWRSTCHLECADDLPRHVGALVEFSEEADFIGLPLGTWAVRELLPLRHSFHAFEGMPVAREFRTFVRGGECLCVHPYWPPDAIRSPSRADWRERLEEAQRLDPATEAELRTLAGRVGERFDGAWSVDFAQHADGTWYTIDMAEMERSFHWQGCPFAPIT